MIAGLVELAEAYGVATEYQDQAGVLRLVPESTVVAVLHALGIAAADAASVAGSLAYRRLEHWRRMLPPVLVMRQSAEATCWVHVPHLTGVRVHIELEGGAGVVDVPQAEHWVHPVEVDGVLTGEALFRLPAGVETGWHLLHASAEDGRSRSCPLIVTPDRLPTPATGGPGRGWGLALQLYALRSERSWGLGDLTDLTDLARYTGFELGADFILLNPVHAAAPVAPLEPSPYLPVSRRFANPLYLRIEAIPEYTYLPEPSRVRVTELAAGPVAASLTSDLLDRDGAWAAKLAALALVHAVPLSPGRAASYRAYRSREGRGLEDFAIWCALAEEHGAAGDWPAPLRDPDHPAVNAERIRLADRVEFHRWCQWVLDDQLAVAQEAARGAGMAIGVVHDLAVGVHPHGADAWSLHDVLAQGVTVGAPPDMYNQLGQDWSQPPWRPDALAEAGFTPYRDMLRTVLRHAGGIRVDHVLGLFRLWWVPAGSGPAQGTYVRYDHEALVGILALEAERAGAVVIGEDLGTVEPWVHDLLRDRGILGTSVLWFERTPDGEVRRPGSWRSGVLASVTTHDLPPTAGYLAGEHIRLRDQLGVLARPAALEWDDHDREMAGWLQMLRTEGLLGVGAGEQDVVEALYRFVLSTPAQLVAVSLQDAVGDRRAQNQPGTHREYPNWQVPLTDREGRAVILEDLPRLDRFLSLMAVLRSG